MEYSVITYYCNSVLTTLISIVYRMQNANAYPVSSLHTRACLRTMKMVKVTVKVVLSRFSNTDIRVRTLSVNMYANLLSQGYTNKYLFSSGGPLDLPRNN